MRTGRVNIRFLLLLSAILIGIVGVGGFMYTLNYMNDTGRHIVQGDSYFEKGELRTALGYYGRAIHKDPGNSEYLRKLEKTLLMIRPETLSEANELYGMYIGILRRGPDQDPRDAEGHIRLLNELQKNARVIGEIDSWRTVERAAENMVARVEPDSPMVWVGRAHLGFAKQRMAFTREEAARAVEELMIVTENAPTIDLAWRGLIAAQLKVAIAVENAINTEAAEQYYVDADSSIRRALEVVPDGPETATIVAYRVALDRDTEEQLRLATGGDLKAPYRTRKEELAIAADRVVKNLKGSTDMGQIIEAERILRRMGWVDGQRLGIEIVESYLNEVPNDDYIRLQLARLKYGTTSFDEAEEFARAVLDAPKMTVGLLARIQPAIRQGAASIQCDIAFRRWTGTDPADAAVQAEHLAKIRAARTQLISLTNNPDGDELVLKADAKLAYAEGDYSRCATLFDRAKRENEGLKEAESYMILASALGKMGQTGSVMENLQEAANRAPGNPTIAVEIARVLMRVKKYDDADRILDSILSERPTFALALAAKETSTRLRNRDAGIIVDPVNAVLQEAQQLAKDGELEKARTLLEASYNGDGRDSPLIITGYTLILMDMGKLDEAKAVASDGAKRFPNDRNLEAILVRLETPDPVESIVQYVTTVLDLEPLQEKITLLTGLNDLANKHEEYAVIVEKSGDTERFLALQDIAARARALEETYFREVMSMGPDDPAVLEYRFLRALNADDMAEVDRIVDRIRATSEEEADALFYEGRKLVKLGEFSSAIDLIERALEMKPVSSIGWRGLGMCYRQVGRVSDAERAYTEAYKRKPDDINIIREFSSLLMQVGKPTQALAILEDALRLMPDDIAIREAYYQAKSSTGQTADVLALRRELAKSNPKDTDNLSSLVTMLGEIRPTPELVVNPNTGRPFTSPQWASMRPDERQKLSQRAQEKLDVEAESTIKLLREQLGDTLRMAMIHANYYRARGRVNEGLELLQNFVDNDPASAEDTRGARALAAYLREINRPDRAVLVLLDARDRQDDEQREIDLAIGNLAFDVSQFETAVRHLELAMENRPSQTLELRIVDALSRLGEFDEAEAKLEASVGDEPYDFVALMLAAQIAEGRGNLAAADGNDALAQKQFESFRANIEAAQRMQPSNVVPQLSLAEFHLRQFQRTGEEARLNEALSALERVDAVDPKRSDTRITRSNIYRARGDIRAAVNELRAAVDDDPENVNLRRSLTQLQVYVGDSRAALQTVQEATNRDPTIAFWHRRAGEIYIAHLREYEKGADAFDEAYKLTGSDDDLHDTIDALLQMDRVPHARILTLIENQGTPIAQNLRLMPRKAQALYIARRRDEARAVLRTAFEAILASTPEGSGPTIELNTWFAALQRIYPEGEEADSEALIMDMTGGEPDGNVTWLLGRFYGARGDVTRAEDLLRTAIELTPDHRKEYRIRQYLDLGGFIVTQERWANAIETYEKVLELEPDNVTCLNNIAYMYAEQLGTPEKGLPFAQRAVAIAPRNADYLDTLGWTHFRLDRFKEAEEALLRSINARPTASAYMHLGWIYLRQGDAQRARINVGRARELEPDAIAMSEIEKLEKELGSR